MIRVLLLVFYGFFVCAVEAQEAQEAHRAESGVEVPARDGNIPRTLWDHRADAALLTRSALSALKAHGAMLTRIVPGDIAAWCPSYRQANEVRRRDFWVGLLSALAKYESAFDPKAIGGAGRWFGLLQIQPSTARAHGCRARTGEPLRHGPDNLSCAIRIMARTVPRDGVVSEGRRGVAADWGPLTQQAKREEMQSWLRAQSYCKPLSSVRPRARPARLACTTGLHDWRRPATDAAQIPRMRLIISVVSRLSPGVARM